MELRVLRYFLLAAREENMTRAAELLHVTQPTLSRQLMQLEQELGTKLFHRGQHSITLTDDGMLLKRRAQELVELADKTAREFAKTEGSLTGELSIGSGETLSMHSGSPLFGRKIHWCSTIFTALPPMKSKTVLKKGYWIWASWLDLWTFPGMSLSVCRERSGGECCCQKPPPLLHTPMSPRKI